MTTRINVNVDQQALLQRSREQTQANRWAFLEGQNRSKVGKEAERQRDVNRAARGLTADGSMYNNRLRLLPQRPEPAAWRTDDLSKVAHAWLDVINTYPSASTGLIGDLQQAISSGLTLGSGNRGFLTVLKARSGDASVEVSTGNQFGSYTHALPAQGYKWEPSYAASYSNGGWTYHAYGTRTFRLANAGDTEYVIKLVLPAGRGACVVLFLKALCKWSVDIQTMHSYTQTVGNVNGGGYQTPPLASQLAAWFTSSAKSADGATVSLGRPAVYNTVYQPYNYAGNAGAVIDLPYQDIDYGPPQGVVRVYGGFLDGYSQNDIAAPTTHLLHSVTASDSSVFYCTPTTIKQVSPSASLAAFINYWIGSFSTATVNIGNAEDNGGLINFQVTVPTLATHLDVLHGLETSALFYKSDSLATQTWDPLIFASLNQFYEFTNPANILDPASIKSRLRSDTRLGAYTLSPDNYADYVVAGAPFYYARSKQTDSAENLGKRVAQVRVNPTSPSFSGNTELHRVWDWDNPNYCRARLLDLGFTEADLTP